MVAPANGVVVVLEKVLEDEYFHDKRMQVSIFMNIFNVHANWFPRCGKSNPCKSSTRPFYGDMFT